MSYAGIDPAATCDTCPDCGQEADMGHSPEQCKRNQGYRACIDCGDLFKGAGRLCNYCFRMVKL